MIKILYAFNGILRKGGTEAVMLNYFNNIDKSRFKIDFLLHGQRENELNNDIHSYLEEQGAALWYVTPRGENYFGNKKDIARILRENKYDIVHSHMDAAGGFFLKQALDAGVSVRVAHSHNTNHQINKGSALKNIAYKTVLDDAVRKVRRYSNVRIACSKEAGNWLFGDSDYTVLNNAVDIAKYKYDPKVRSAVREKLGLEGKNVIGHVGRFSEQKNHAFLTDIFAETAKLDPKAVLMLIGEGELKESIEKKCRDAGISDKVMFMGRRTDVSELMQAMDLFLLPSLFEGLPVCAVEAQTAGLPAVISESVSPDVKITQNVSFVSLSSPPAVWAKRITETLSETLRADTQKDIIASGYDIKSIVKTLEALYEESFEKYAE